MTTTSVLWDKVVVKVIDTDFFSASSVRPVEGCHDWILMFVDSSATQTLSSSCNKPF